MKYKSFTFNIIIRTLFILGLMALSIYLFLNTEYIKSAFGFIILVLQLIEFISYVNKTNVDFTSFLNSIAHNDFSSNYTSSFKGQSFQDLYKSFEQLNKKFKSINFEREMHYQHLQTLIEHMDIGIISVNSDNEIHLVNKAFKDLFDKPYLTKSHSINKLDRKFVKLITEMQHMENKLFSLLIGNHYIDLSVNAGIYKLKEQEYKLITVKNIQNELDTKELESYQKLIRVLTHEIMNSVSPIVSLSSTLDEGLRSGKKIDIQNLKDGIHAIHDRSKGLLHFTNEYKKLSKLPQPIFVHVILQDIFNNLKVFYKNELFQKNIEFDLQHTKKIKSIYADKGMLEQTLINIIKNAIEAIEDEKGIISISVSLDKPANSVCLQIKDNGIGIPKEQLDKVFIPFFTNKDEGNGIGLSLCKQIMKLHHGKITIESDEGKETNVKLFFPHNPKK